MDPDIAQAIITHYERRHAFRGDFFGQQPFANYGYWTSADMDFEQAGAALTLLVGASAGLKPGDRLLDVACGYGAGAVLLAKRFELADVLGVDLTPVRVETGNEYVAAQGLSDRVRLQQGEATALSLADQSYDKCVCIESAFHFDSRRDFLQEAARVLRPGGTLALTDIIPREGVDPASYLTGETTTQSEVCLDMPVNAYDAGQYRRFLEDAGFEAVRIESIIDWSRRPFTRRLAALAESTGGERGQQLARMAKRLSRLMDQGEDYVLVVARRSAPG